MLRGRARIRAAGPALAGLMVLAGCSPLAVDVRVLASDAMGGRNNQMEGSARARRYLIDRLDDFAVGAETGGERLTAAVGRAVRPGRLDTHQLSWIFGQGRSDYLPFIQAGVPTVFFSDSTGPCYHTAQDEADIVDYRKLHQQVLDGVRLARDLAGVTPAPAFVPGTPPATYDDAVALREVADRALPDLDRFDADQQAALLAFDAALADIVAAGPDEFGPDDAATVLSAAANAVEVFASGDCDGFTRP
jgi:Peptidase family M28